MLSPEFLELWSKIKQKTAYRVSIDTEQLVKNCVKAFQEMPHIPKTRLVSQTADIHIQQSGISHMEREMRTMEIANDYQALPDIITAISDVKMFFKIPSRFKIETPIGTYNPDWAVYLNKNGEEKLYFVLETKGDTSFMHLKTSEQLKIHCGKEHFKALDAGVELETATSWTELRKRI